MDLMNIKKIKDFMKNVKFENLESQILWKTQLTKTGTQTWVENLHNTVSRKKVNLIITFPFRNSDPHGFTGEFF